MVVELDGVAVVGGGPVGCLTALYLLRRGFTVDIFESRADMRKDIAAAGRSINLILTSRGLNALNEVGLTREILDHCVPVYGRQLHLLDGSQKYQAYGPDESYCNYAISRATLNILLLNAAEKAGAKIHFSHPVDHVDIGRKLIYMYVRDHSQFRTTPRLKYTPKQQQQQQQQQNNNNQQRATPGHTYGVAVKAQCIFACDGSNSRVRQSLHQFLQSSTGVSNGVATIFGHSLSAMEELQGKPPQITPSSSTTTSTTPTTTTTSTTTTTTTTQFPVDFRSAFDLSGSYETSIPLRVSYLELLLSKEQNIDKNTGEQILSTKSLHIWPRGHHFLMALPNRDESFTLTLYLPDVPIGDSPSFASLKTNDEIVDFFRHFYSNALDLLPNLVNQWTSHPKGFLGSIQSFPWHFRSNVVLLGDAGASVTPFYGQGCNSGMESVNTVFHHIDTFAKIKVPTSTPTNTTTPLIAIFNNKQAKNQYTPYVLQRAFSAMSANHKVNTDAIATMAVENYIEMGTSTSNMTFLRGAQYENVLALQFPQYLSRYAMTTHTLIPYSVVYTLGEIQKQSIIKQLIDEEIASKGPITAETLLTLPVLDIKRVKHLLDKKYQPVLDKYHVNAHALRDVTRELVQNALNGDKSGASSTSTPTAKL